MQENTLIDVRNVKKVYHVGTVDVHALRGVDLQIAAGDICSIIGRTSSAVTLLPSAGTGIFATASFTACCSTSGS